MEQSFEVLIPVCLLNVAMEEVDVLGLVPAVSGVHGIYYWKVRVSISCTEIKNQIRWQSI